MGLSLGPSWLLGLTLCGSQPGRWESNAIGKDSMHQAHPFLLGHNADSLKLSTSAVNHHLTLDTEAQRQGVTSSQFPLCHPQDVSHAVKGL